MLNSASMCDGHVLCLGSSRRSLYDTFVASIESYLALKPTTSQPPSVSPSRDDAAVTSAPHVALDTRDYVAKLDIRDPLLQLNFERLLSKRVPRRRAEPETETSALFSRYSVISFYVRGGGTCQ